MAHMVHTEYTRFAPVHTMLLVASSRLLAAILDTLSLGLVIFLARTLELTNR